MKRIFIIITLLLVTLQFALADSHVIKGTDTYTEPVATDTTTGTYTNTDLSADATTDTATAVEPVSTTDTTTTESAGTVLETSAPTDEPSDSTTVIAPLPPSQIDIVYKDDVVGVMWDAPTTSDSLIVQYVLYRKCDSSEWKPLNEVSAKYDNQILYKTFDYAPIDNCAYAVASISSFGQESELSVAKLFVKPTAEEVVATDTKIVTEETTVSEPTPTFDGEADLKERILLALQTDPIVISGIQEITAEALNEQPDTVVENVEMFIKKDTSTYREYIGKAQYDGVTNTWSVMFDSRSYPNGKYLLIPRGVTIKGDILFGEIIHISILNKILTVPSLEPDSYKEELIEYTQEISKDVFTADAKLLEQESALKEDFSNSVTALNKKQIEETIDRRIDEMTALSIERDEVALDRKRQQIAEQFNMTFSVGNRDDSSSEDVEQFKQLQDRVRDNVESIEIIARERNALLEDRVRADVFKDADSDGISNFDEINIYKTDPFDADTDKDGVSDGAELSGGYNPLNNKPEAVIVYEEAKRAGVVNADAFAVRSVKVAVTERPVNAPASSVRDSATTTATDVEMSEQAVIETTVGLEFEGVAPPNSFVTLYIYSTPIIVTVKTDNDGNWSYVLDKELEDGEHEVYVAMTDNAGKIYMKSNPLNFVKEAQAVTYEEPILLSAETPGFFNGKYIYVLIGFLVVVILGVLVFIGNRPKRSLESIELD